MHYPDPISRQYLSQQLQLHYAEWGNPAAPPLLLLHGGRDHCRSWDWFAAEFAQDWRIIAPDLRGHGDSAHVPGGHYTMEDLVFDLAELVHQDGLAPLTIVAHSLGGNVALRYAGLYPDAVRKLVAIEGLGPSPRMRAEREAIAPDIRLRDWIEALRATAGRQPRRYPTIDVALERMQAENPHLAPERARHLTVHGLKRNDDGSFSWKFDNHVRLETPIDLTATQLAALWGRIACPTLLVYGAESWASNPEIDGRAAHFRNARVSLYQNAGHWVHHDQHNAFVAEVRRFLEE